MMTCWPFSESSSCFLEFDIFFVCCELFGVRFTSSPLFLKFGLEDKDSLDDLVLKSSYKQLENQIPNYSL